MKNQLSLLMILLVLISCGKRTQKSDEPRATEQQEVSIQQEAEEEMGFVSGAPSNSVIVAELVEKFIHPTPETQIDQCQSNPCQAKVKIVALKQRGMGYDGGLDEGQVVEIHFDFSTENTKELFPELNEHLPGLEEGDYFEAEVFVKAEHPSNKRIRTYKRLN